MIEAGQPLPKIDLEYIDKHAKSTITPVVFTNLTDGQSVSLKKERKVEMGVIMYRCTPSENWIHFKHSR